MRKWWQKMLARLFLLTSDTPSFKTAEPGRVQATVNDPGVLAAVDRYGLTEYLGAGPEALNKFARGETANSVGYTLMRAAVDWRRAGLTHLVSK
jgi:hypothetical protein